MGQHLESKFASYEGPPSSTPQFDGIAALETEITEAPNEAEGLASGPLLEEIPVAVSDVSSSEVSTPTLTPSRSPSPSLTPTPDDSPDSQSLQSIAHEDTTKETLNNIRTALEGLSADEDLLPEK
eukprot:gene6957-8298_t